MSAARGFRLAKGRAYHLRKYLTEGQTAIQAQNYQPRSSGNRDPEALFPLERFVAGSERLSAISKRVTSVFAALEFQTDPLSAGRVREVLDLCHGPLLGRNCLRNVREHTDRGAACMACGLWRDEKAVKTLVQDGVEKEVEVCDWCTEFGDAVLLVKTTEAAMARARIAWPAWMVAEKSWRWSHRSRAAARDLAADHEAMKSERRAWEARGAGVELLEQTAARVTDGALFVGCTLDVTGQMMWRLDRWQSQGFHLDAVAEDVIERAIAATTRDETLLTAIRREADERISSASRLMTDAWNLVEDKEREAEKAREDERVKGDGRGKGRLAAASALLRKLPPPKTRTERIAACDALLAYMRAGELAAGTPS